MPWREPAGRLQGIRALGWIHVWTVWAANHRVLETGSMGGRITATMDDGIHSMREVVVYERSIGRSVGVVLVSRDSATYFGPA